MPAVPAGAGFVVHRFIAISTVINVASVKPPAVVSANCAPGDCRPSVFVGAQRKDRVFYANEFDLEKFREHAVLGQRPV